MSPPASQTPWTSTRHWPSSRPNSAPRSRSGTSPASTTPRSPPCSGSRRARCVPGSPGAGPRSPTGSGTTTTAPIVLLRRRHEPADRTHRTNRTHGSHRTRRTARRGHRRRAAQRRARRRRSTRPRAMSACPSPTPGRDSTRRRVPVSVAPPSPRRVTRFATPVAALPAARRDEMLAVARHGSVDNDELARRRHRPLASRLAGIAVAAAAILLVVGLAVSIATSGSDNGDDSSAAGGSAADSATESTNTATQQERTAEGLASVPPSATSAGPLYDFGAVPDEPTLQARVSDALSSRSASGLDQQDAAEDLAGSARRGQRRVPRDASRELRRRADPDPAGPGRVPGNGRRGARVPSRRRLAGAHRRDRRLPLARLAVRTPLRRTPEACTLPRRGRRLRGLRR